MALNEGLQLLPGTKKRLGIKVPGENRFLYIGSAILGAAIVASLWFNFSTQNLKNELKSVDDQISATDQKRNKQAEANIRLIQHQLDLTSNLINEHYYFSQSLLKISSLMQEQVQLANISINQVGKISFGGFAGGYAIIAKQVAAFLADDSVKDLTIGKMKSQTDGTIEFGMDILFDEAKLLQRKK